MSHRVTVETNMTDRVLALKTLDAENIQYRETGDRVSLLSGDFAGSELNLTTGKLVSGDVDYHKVDQSKMGLLRQAYAEQKYRAEAFKEGVSIESRTVDKDGVVRLKCRTS